MADYNSAIVPSHNSSEFSLSHILNMSKVVKFNF